MINKLIEKIRKTNAPIVVGLDPMLNYIPKHIQENAFAEFGETLEGAAEAIWQFNKGIVDATYDLIPAVKPQIAMYEQFGIPGLQAYKKTVDYCKSKDLVVIGDIKRGDIGSTSAAYAVGHLGHVAGRKFQDSMPYLMKILQQSIHILELMVSNLSSMSARKKIRDFLSLSKHQILPVGEFQDRMIEGKTAYMSGLARRLHSGAKITWAERLQLCRSCCRSNVSGNG